ncbi:MAG: Maf family nucleotide pyrophosphatase [Magnetococcus sp. DMHC-6]
MDTLNLVLASRSQIRRELLLRLGLPFTVQEHLVEESPLPGESLEDRAVRLSEAKARSLAEHYPQALIIGSDQVAVLEGQVLHKPGSAQQAMVQLTRSSGRRVDFFTGLSLYNSSENRVQNATVHSAVYFRSLSQDQLSRYIQKEQPFDCAGSFKAEGLGIALFERLEASDPTALLGLPLIRLVAMLEQEGVALF